MSSNGIVNPKIIACPKGGAGFKIQNEPSFALECSKVIEYQQFKPNVNSISSSFWEACEVGTKQSWPLSVSDLRMNWPIIAN